MTKTGRTDAYQYLQWLPNAITLCRSLLALAALWAALQANWQLALWLFLAALGTDFLDGLAAKKLQAQSAFGEQFDALSDSFAVVAGMLSLSLTGHLSWWVTIVVLGAGLAIGSDRLFEQTVWRWRTALAVSFLFIAWTGIGWFYASLAFGWSWLYAILTVGVLSVCGLLKRHRIRAWVGSGEPHDQTH